MWGGRYLLPLCVPLLLEDGGTSTEATQRASSAGSCVAGIPYCIRHLNPSTRGAVWQTHAPLLYNRCDKKFPNQEESCSLRNE
jgi:hypothetical protein